MLKSIDQCFSAALEWTFFSEDEIERRLTGRRADITRLEAEGGIVGEGQQELVDLAIRNTGMGYADVLVYDPISGGVFKEMGGGSSGPSRVARQKIRLKLDVVTTTPLETWWASEKEE